VPIDVLWKEMYWEADLTGPAPTRILKSVQDDCSLVERFLSNLKDDEFPYLSFISHETVTIFHQQHIGQLIAELQALRARDHEAQVAKHLDAVLQLVSAALGPEDTLIAFQVRQPINTVAA
jgi:hypothetical protein